MKKTLLSLAVLAIGSTAFAQHYEWTCAQINNNQKFASAEEAVAAGYLTMWGSTDYIGIPAKDLINNEEIVVSLACPYNFAYKGNGKGSGYND
ncbi:MAG: hypothetical protein K6E73_10345, partial [Bacteroidales bacterium]|nr:hypothetical protein [Bacteroidales bacterium]